MPGIAPPGPGSALGVERDGLRLLVFLLILVSIGQVHNFLGLAALRPALLLAAGTVIYAFLSPQQLNQGALSRTWPPKVMMALAVMACISVPFGIWPGLRTDGTEAPASASLRPASAPTCARA